MTKLVDLEGKKKAREKPCRHCGRTPACPDWTCERLKSVVYEANSDGSYEQYEYVTQESPRELHVHIYGASNELVKELMEGSPVVGPSDES